MFVSKILILGFILLFLNFCDEETDPCLERALADPFEMNLYFEPFLVDSLANPVKNATSFFLHEILACNHMNRTILITCYKKHCGGQLGGPMKFRYAIRIPFIESQLGGQWSVNVANETEELWIDIQYEDESHISESIHVTYKEFHTHSNDLEKFIWPFYICPPNGNLSFSPKKACL